MIKRELKVNLKGFIIWFSILLIMFLMVYLIYPYIITDDTVKSLDEMLKVFPKQVLKTFNMDISSISTAYGWLKSEGLMYLLLIVGFYSSYLGSTILLKEESEKTTEYLCMLPIKRSKIVTNKIIVGITYILLMVLLLGVFNYIALLISCDFNHKEYLLLSISPLLVSIPLFFINMFISMFLHKTKKTVGISLGLVFIFYFLNVISELSDKVEFFKYFSIYSLANTRRIILDNSINPVAILLSIIISIIFLVGSYIKYDKKELI